MKSRVHPKYKTKYRVTNWADYDKALVQRGNITLWISDDAIASWKPAPTGLRGAQRKFSDHAIETALTLRLVFKLPLRQAEGFLRSLLSLMGVDLEAPDHTTLSRRSQRLDLALSGFPTNEPIHLIVDSTGLSIVGEGEWAAAKHGGRGKRAWKKLHLGVDQSGVIVAKVLTDGNVTMRRPLSTSSMRLGATLRASLRTQPMTRSRSTMPPQHEVPKSSFRRSRQQRDRDTEALYSVLAIAQS